MTGSPAHTESHHHPFRGFDRSVERMLGVDARILYGMGVPMLIIVGLVVLLALSPATWLAAVIVAIEIVALMVVVLGVLEMMRNDRGGGA